MFNSESKTTGREQADVTGLIGQYAHGNEPSHHMTYLYNFIGKPEKTTEKVHFILDNFYKNAPDGLIGNEDCGQMSAWYVLSSMGIYAVTPGKAEWSLTVPYFKNIKVNLEDGNMKEISPEMVPGERSYFGLNRPEQSNNFGYEFIIPVPVILAESKSFKDKLMISMENNDFNNRYNPYVAKIKYKIEDETQKTTDFKIYSEPFEINTSSTITAYSVISVDAKLGGSSRVSATFFKKPNNYTITIKSTYDKQYHAGGPDGLLDGINGTENWRKGDWQGYQGQDFESTIDLQIEKNISDFNGTFLQDSRSWILMPTKVEYYASTDNVNFTLVGTVNNTIDPKETENKITNFSFKSNKEIKAKYIKVKAYNFGKLPEWHQGAGGEAYIFVDEITIK